MDIQSIERPSPRLLAYYLLSSFALGPLFFLVFIPRAIRFRTLRYQFDEEGVSASWGGLMRREIHLAYDRIQDIHLRSNVVERWLSLARIEIQTASGASQAEMTIEGVEAYEQVRDYLYGRMRGSKDRPSGAEAGAGTSELAAALLEVASELRAVRTALEARRTAGEEGPHA